MIRLFAALLLGLGFVGSVQGQTPFTILFLGDSLTEGYGLEANESFPSLITARLAEAGRDDIRVINGGVSGSTSASALSRLQWFARSKPDLMVLALGANDGLRGLAVNELEANLAKTIEFAQSNDIEVALTGMLIPPNYGPEYTDAFAAVFPMLAERYHLPFMEFLLQDVAAVPELNQSDGIHPNAAGTKIVADNVWTFLQPLLPAH
ncbi:MAG TPA: arylesterase [Hyphomicrobiales bacterium]|nr:arylesterase [Hyphomicrobiales bacterium]